MDNSPTSIRKAQLISCLHPPIVESCKKGCESWRCVFSPDCSYLAWCCHSWYIVLVRWDRQNVKPLLPVDAVPHSAEGDGLNHDVTLSLSNEHCQILECPHPVRSLTFGPTPTESDGKPQSGKQHYRRFNPDKSLFLLAGLANGRIRLWEVPSGTLMLELSDHTDSVSSLSLSSDGTLRLVSASRDMTLKVWDLRDDGNRIKSLNGHGRAVLACCWSPDSKLVCSVGFDRSVYLWDMDSYVLRTRLNGHLNTISACCFSSDGGLLATASHDSTVRVWNTRTGATVKILRHLNPPPSPLSASDMNGAWIWDLVFTPNLTSLVTIAQDGMIRFWSLNSDCEEPASQVPTRDALCCTISPCSRALAVGSHDGTVSLYSVPISISSLKHLCRSALHRSSLPDSVNCLPQGLQPYVHYRQWEQ